MKFILILLYCCWAQCPLGICFYFPSQPKNIDICRKEERPFTIYSKHGQSMIVRITYMRGENAINFFGVDACPCFCIKMNWTVVWARIVNFASTLFMLVKILFLYEFNLIYCFPLIYLYFNILVATLYNMLLKYFRTYLESNFRCHEWMYRISGRSDCYGQ